MIPLVITSCIMWILIIDKTLYYYFLEKNDLKLHEIIAVLRDGRIPEKADGICTFFIKTLLEKKTGDPVVDCSILDESRLTIKSHITRHLAAIAVFAAVAPLFGLLGTVAGMITTFDVITTFGTGNAKAMAGGISKALVTTQSGLLVAIPGMFMAAFLYQKSIRIEKRITETVMILKRCLK